MGCTTSSPAGGGSNGSYNEDGTGGKARTASSRRSDTRTERETEEPFVVGRTQRVYKTKGGGTKQGGRGGSSGKGSTVASSLRGGEDVDEIVLVNGRLSERDVEKRQTKSLRNEVLQINENLTIRYAFATQRGFYPDNHGKPNQDALCLLPRWGGVDNDAFFGVFDGHGPYGHDCANYVKKNLPTVIAKYIRSNRLKLYNTPTTRTPSSTTTAKSPRSSKVFSSSGDEEEKTPEGGADEYDIGTSSIASSNKTPIIASNSPTNTRSSTTSNTGTTTKKKWDPKSWPMLSPILLEECLRQGHLDCNKNIHANETIKDKLSGTTSISATFHNNAVSISNVGDSRAILGRRVPFKVEPERVAQVLEYLVPDGDDNPGEVGGSSSHETSKQQQSQAQDPPESLMQSASKILQSFHQSTSDHMIKEGFEVSTLQSVALSVDQTPYRTDELERVKKAGARVLSLDQLEGIEPIHENWRKLDLGEDIDVEGDPPRVWVKDGDYPGTAFTRSIGDSAADAIGVIAEPEIKTMDLTRDDKMIILGSDGIFEFLPNQDVIDICAKYPNDPLSAASAIVKASYDLWLTYELRTDDITIIVINLEWNDDNKQMKRASKNGEGEPSVTVPIPPMVPHNILVETKKGAISDLTSMEKKENQRARELSAAPNSGYRPSIVEKNMLQEELLLGVIEYTSCFANITTEQSDMILKAMEPFSIKKGDYLVHEGDIVDKFYVLEEGTLGFRMQKEGQTTDGTNADTGGVLLHSLVRDGGIGLCPTFGEVAMIQTVPSAYSIIAETDCTLWSLERSTFQMVRSEMNLNYRRILYYKLSQMKELNDLNPVHIWKLVKSMETVEFEDGDTICTKDTEGNYSYIITEGTCRVLEGSNVDTTYSEGDVLGREILNQEEGKCMYQHTIEATSPIQCMRLEQTRVFKFKDVVNPMKMRKRAQSISQLPSSGA